MATGDESAALSPSSSSASEGRRPARVTSPPLVAHKRRRPLRRTATSTGGMGPTPPAPSHRHATSHCRPHHRAVTPHKVEARREEDGGAQAREREEKVAAPAVTGERQREVLVNPKESLYILGLLIRPSWVCRVDTFFGGGPCNRLPSKINL